MLALGAAVLGLALFFAGSVSRLLTREPFIDEAWYSMPAWSLATRGEFGTPVLETSASPMPGMNVSLRGIRENTYWVMPLPIFVQAAWYKITGFGIYSLRAFCIFWGLVALAAWLVFIRTLSDNWNAGLLAMAIIAMDPVFISTASLGRMDMMSAGLGVAGLASYVVVRRHSLGKAIFVAHACVAASGLSHPNGGLIYLLVLLTTMMVLDRRRLRPVHALAAAAPYALGAAGWGLYILRDPDSFMAQFLGNSGGRFGTLAALSPLREAQRYLDAYGMNPETAGLAKLKVLLLLFYAAAFAALVVSSDLRKKPVAKILLLLSGVAVVALTIIDNYKVQWYLIHTVPFFGAVAGFVLAAILPRFKPLVASGILVVVLAGVLAVPLAGVVRASARDPYHRGYLPAVEYVRRCAFAGSLVMASSEFGFGYGFDQNLIDDIRLGAYTGASADMIVTDSRHQDAWSRFKRIEPDAYEHITAILADDYEKTLVTPTHTVYVRRPVAEHCSAN